MALEALTGLIAFQQITGEPLVLAPVHLTLLVELGVLCAPCHYLTMGLSLLGRQTLWGWDGLFVIGVYST